MLTFQQPCYFRDLEQYYLFIIATAWMCLAFPCISSEKNCLKPKERDKEDIY